MSTFEEYGCNTKHGSTIW